MTQSFRITSDNIYIVSVDFQDNSTVLGWCTISFGCRIGTEYKAFAVLIENLTEETISEFNDLRENGSNTEVFEMYRHQFEEKIEAWKAELN
jgi:hypothetical protein